MFDYELYYNDVKKRKKRGKMNRQCNLKRKKKYLIIINFGAVIVKGYKAIISALIIIHSNI